MGERLLSAHRTTPKVARRLPVSQPKWYCEQTRTREIQYINCGRNTDMQGRGINVTEQIHAGVHSDSSSLPFLSDLKGPFPVYDATSLGVTDACDDMTHQRRPRRRRRLHDCGHGTFRNEPACRKATPQGQSSLYTLHPSGVDRKSQASAPSCRLKVESCEHDLTARGWNHHTLDTGTLDNLDIPHTLQRNIRIGPPVIDNTY